MAYKVLAQDVVTVDSDLVTVNVYTVPSGKSAMVSTIVACFTSIEQYKTGTMFISVRVNGAVASTKQRIFTRLLSPTKQGDSFFLTLGVTLSAGDVLSVTGTLDGAFTCAINVFGDEF